MDSRKMPQKDIPRSYSPKTKVWLIPYQQRDRIILDVAHKEYIFFFINLKFCPNFSKRLFGVELTLGLVSTTLAYHGDCRQSMTNVYRWISSLIQRTSAPKPALFHAGRGECVGKRESCWLLRTVDTNALGHDLMLSWTMVLRRWQKGALACETSMRGVESTRSKL